MASPTLSICIPAYNRPLWLKRSLESIVLDTDQKNFQEIEIIVSDDSTNIESRQVSEDVLKCWPGKWKYVQNIPSLGMAQNWNQAIQIASGKYVLILHDDDYLLSKAIPKILERIFRINTEEAIFLFGVNVVDQHGRVMKKQVKCNQYAPPKKALQDVLSNSSFVRFPGIVIAKSTFEEIGYFDSTIGGVADLDMWTRLFGSYGVWYVSNVTAAYTVHSDALTMKMFSEQTIKQVTLLFKRVQDSSLLNASEIEECQANFLHQFILAGTFRHIRRGQWNEASSIIKLFNLPLILSLRSPLKWIFLRKFFEIIL